MGSGNFKMLVSRAQHGEPGFLCLNGHLKSGHLGSVQNRPLTESVRDMVVLPFFLLIGQIHFGTPTARAAF